VSSPPVQLWTDGACAGNPGPGGWAALLIMGTDEQMLSGDEDHTTNNRMELLPDRRRRRWGPDAKAGSTPDIAFVVGRAVLRQD